MRFETDPTQRRIGPEGVFDLHYADHCISLFTYLFKGPRLTSCTMGMEIVS